MNLESCIELYSVIIQDYMECMCKSQIIKDTSNSYSLLHIGWKTVSHIFNILYSKYSGDVEPIYEHARRSYLFYLEYIEQTNFCNDNEAVIFVYNKLADDVTSTETTRSMALDKDVQCQINCITNCVYVWKNKSISQKNRCELGKLFLQSYLLLLCDPKRFQLSTILYQIIDFETEWDMNTYVEFFNEFYFYISQKKEEIYSDERVGSMALALLSRKKSENTGKNNVNENMSKFVTDLFL